ncbi:GDYXXLXY domain-containing protein [Nocardioides sp.]|uniref:GDYXXLXY domain-containing protein n=1 Tax=Nocardioides sp. TaxID=35761 RepID=UPI00273774B4|nr:GDYXXLXY domain-containing protein [Nocardioides sp.]MDP3891881.1 GDYXXLXY domain-containing protein [Nocardioides sp.]
MSTLRSRPAVLALALVVQLGLVGVAVNGQLSARITGEEYLLRVAPFDPHDPFRGAYVDLDYPDLPQRAGRRTEGTVFVPLVPGEGEVWTGGRAQSERPDQGPFLRCSGDSWRLSCGIESMFLPPDKALELERSVADGDHVAVVRVDGRGNAALIDVRRP